MPSPGSWHWERFFRKGALRYAGLLSAESRVPFADQETVGSFEGQLRQRLLSNMPGVTAGRRPNHATGLTGCTWIFLSPVHEFCEIGPLGRRHVRTPMWRMWIEALNRRSRTTRSGTGHKSIRICCVGWRSHTRAKSARRTYLHTHCVLSREPTLAEASLLNTELPLDDWATSIFRPRAILSDQLYNHCLASDNGASLVRFKPWRTSVGVAFWNESNNLLS